MVTTPYQQGYGFENELHNKLIELGYEVMRAYKSKGPYDLMAYCDKYRPLLIEAKYWKAMTATPNSDINNKSIKRLLKKQNTIKLTARALASNAYPLIAFKIKGKGYLFYRIDTGERFFDVYKNLSKLLTKVLSKIPFT